MLGTWGTYGIACSAAIGPVPPFLPDTPFQTVPAGPSSQVAYQTRRASRICPGTPWRPGTGLRPVRRRCSIGRRARETRKPRLLFSFPGEFLLRFAERQFLALLFQLPPRFTRFEPPWDKAPRCFLTPAAGMNAFPPGPQRQAAAPRDGPFPLRSNGRCGSSHESGGSCHEIDFGFVRISQDDSGRRGSPRTSSRTSRH